MYDYELSIPFLLTITRLFAMYAILYKNPYCTAIHVPISLQLSILLNLSAVPLPLMALNAYPFSEI